MRDRSEKRVDPADVDDSHSLHTPRQSTPHLR